MECVVTNMKVLVTGAAGFIGSALSSVLANRGFQVIAIDSISDYYSIELKKRRVSEILIPSGVEFMEIQLADSETVSNLFGENRFDHVFHLAAQPGVRVPMEKSGSYVRDNLIGFSNVLINSVTSNVQNFLYASSSSVYGNSSRFPYREDERDLHPLSFYGATKLSNEILANSSVLNSSTRARGLRFFSVYGPWGRPDMAYFKIGQALLSGTEFGVLGDGNKQRDFTYIDDVVSMILKLSDELSERPKGYSDVVNVGGGAPCTLNHMIEVLEELSGSTLNKVYNFNDVKDSYKTEADISLQRELTGTSPETALEEGLQKFWNWLEPSFKDI